ncbi:MAG: geranylgeranylglyceryl/heptaprenylglyceryl phosphate synthase [Flavobacteriales bacterium]|nr:MAG: geranylgeranylglyceryl/heptaprenylglyceryl phosphate synthase [Flavobacteriales bacterium]
MIYHSILEKKKAGTKQLAVLVDPDNINKEQLFKIIDKSILSGVDYFFVGGSLMVSDKLDECIVTLKENSNIPAILFPGSPMQISSHADGILFLSLISGRNPEALIGYHVIAAPYVQKAQLEVLPTGYMLIDGGAPTTVSYMSNSAPIPNDKNDIARSTAMAGEMLGLKLIYMDAGSGAKKSITPEMIAEVSENTKVPLIVGGGINTSEKAADACKAGADIIVIGNAVEQNPTLLNEISSAVKEQKHAVSRHIESR